MKRETPSGTDMLLEQVKMHCASADNRELDEEKIELVIFTMAGRFYALKGECVREILVCPPITPVPGCPDLFRGIINVRGVIESVIDLHKIFEMADKPLDAKNRILLASSGDIRSGILVDGVEDVITIEKNRIKPVPSSLPPAVKYCARGGGIFYSDEYVILLNLKRVFKKIVPDNDIRGPG